MQTAPAHLDYSPRQTSKKTLASSPSLHLELPSPAKIDVPRRNARAPKTFTSRGPERMSRAPASSRNKIRSLFLPLSFGDRAFLFFSFPFFFFTLAAGNITFNNPRRDFVAGDLGSSAKVAVGARVRRSHVRRLWSGR